MRVGFVGLGAMGMHMARNLHRAGLLTALYNRTADKARALAAELKVTACADLAALAASVDAVVYLRLGGRRRARRRAGAGARACARDAA